jgi:hypothetical protein
MVGGSIPVGVADGLLGVDQFGAKAAGMPYAAALTLSLVATAVAAWVFHRVVSDVAIRRTAG